jgi:GTP cyclohydrolase II
MLASLNVASIRLLTNNPRKIQELEKLGTKVTGRIPHVIPANEWDRFYLETKARRSGHLIELDMPHQPEQNDSVIIEGDG